MDDVTLNQKVGEKLIRSGGRLVWGTHRVKLYNYTDLIVAVSKY